MSYVFISDDKDFNIGGVGRFNNDQKIDVDDQKRLLDFGKLVLYFS